MIKQQLGTETASVSREVAHVQQLLKQSGLTYSMHSAGTTVGEEFFFFFFLFSLFHCFFLSSFFFPGGGAPFLDSIRFVSVSFPSSRCFGKIGQCDLPSLQRADRWRRETGSE